MKIKHILTVLLSCIFVVGAMTVATAQDGENSKTVTDYNGFVTAMADETISEIILDGNIELTSKYYIGRAVTIDGQNKYSIVANNENWRTDNYKHLIGVNSDNITLKNITLDCNSQAQGVNVYCAQNAFFENVTVTNSKGWNAAVTVNGSTLTIKNFALENFKGFVAIDVDNGSNVTSSLGLYASGTIDLGGKPINFSSDVKDYAAQTDFSNATKADGTPYYEAYKLNTSGDVSGYISTVGSVSTTSNVNIKLIADVSVANNITVKDGKTFNVELDGKNLVFDDGFMFVNNGSITVTDSENSGTFAGNVSLSSEEATFTMVGGTYTGTVTPYSDAYVAYVEETKENGIITRVYSNAIAVAQIGNTKYATLTEAFAAAADGDTIKLRPVTINEGTVKLPATLTNVTLEGDGVNTVIENTKIMSADGNSVCYDGLTFKNIVFNNSNIELTGWRTGDVTYKNLSFEGNKFNNYTEEGTQAAIHINLDASEAVENLYVKNNVISGVSGGDKSGVYAQATGEIVVEGNLIKNVAFRSFIIQITTDDGIADTLTVTNNTFRDSASGRLQALGNNSEGTDSVVITVKENAILGTTNAQSICFWNFNEETTTADFSCNYYDVDPTNEFGKFYYNGSASSFEDIIAMNVLPYYTEAAFDENGKYTELSKLADGLTNDITVNFEEVTPEVEGEKTYNINLTANSEIINRLNSGDLTFKLTETDGTIAYEIIDIENDNITVAPVNNEENRYEFHFGTKTNVENDTAKEITIAQVKFTGYGTFTFVVDAEKTTNAVHTTTTVDNIVDTYLPEGTIESDGTEAEGTLDLGTGASGTITVPTRLLTINLTFPNAIENNTYTYQQMKVTVSGGDLENAIVVDLGSGAEMPVIATSVKPDATVSVTDDSVYQIVIANALTANTAYNVEVSGAGYRTARYTVTMQGEDTDGKVLNFWNNVKDNKTVVEEDKDSSARTVTYLAGDIVKDNTINIYDLSAVVSYFGEEMSTEAYHAYAKYDLNRDGKIDSKDVAYVLVSWAN